MSKRHWTPADFVVTDESPAYDDSPTTNQSGYCRKCGADMQRFGGDGTRGPLKHYHGHGNYRRTFGTMPRA